jgi:hypothetical protein
MASQVKHSLNIYLQDKSHILSTQTKQEGCVGNPSDLGAGFEPKPTHQHLCLRKLSQSIRFNSRPLTAKLHQSDLKTQSVPRCKHFSSRL